MLNVGVVKNETYYGRNKQGTEGDSLIRITFRYNCSELVVFIAADSFQSKDIERGWEKDREDEEESAAIRLDDERKNSQYDAEESGHHSSELRAFAERSGDEERPACED